MNRGARRWLWASMIVGALLGLGACSSVAYYAQAARGQSAILLNRQPIDKLLADTDLDPELQRRLQWVVEAREFAAAHLGLPSGGSYTTYVDPGRPYMLWNVFAAPPDSLEPVLWCFPIAGCVSYRGYFSERGAQRYAQRLQQRGMDVYVGGVDAYSTLGWFRDPVPATVLRRPEHRLVGLIFHELAHQRYYLPGDTSFNESFASFVEQEGLRRWFDGRQQPDGFARYLRETRERDQFIQFVLDYRRSFDSLYRQELAPAELGARKTALQAQMRLQWAEQGSRAYDGWFNGPLNNAQLNTVGAYSDWVPAFAALLSEQGGDLDAFYPAVAELGEMPADQRRQRLMQLLAAAAPL